MTYEYIAEGFLEEGTPTYVERKADSELYAALKAGQFCYVFNARKTGKTSLQVKVQSKLEQVGFACSVIDLEGKDTHETTLEKWYNGLLKDITKELKLKVNLSNWIKDNSWLSPLDRFSEFVETVLLAQISKPIVIFIDEIDSVHSLKFPIDDFFAFIRSCYNKRANNPNYNRLSFCLLGVASPSDLIKDKQRTPFNIGKAISLEGFKPDEVEPLLRGLEGKFGDPKAVMREILGWTGGQPFLTQKLCKFMVEESEKDNRRSVEEVVRARIIEDWVSQDNPEHLRTIRDRILANERQASALLELYQQILQLGEIDSNNSIEVSQLRLSGLVVKKQDKLRVYNLIYRNIFNINWIETQLWNLCPYAENLRGWLDSKYKDKSRLLRGKALQDGLEWSKDKSLSNQYTLFLSVSENQEKKEELDLLEIEAALKRESKDKEAAEQRNQVFAEANHKLEEANKKAKRRIRVGSIILVLSLLGSLISGSLAVVSLTRIEEQAKNVSLLSELSGELQNRRKNKEADEARKQLGLSQDQEIKENHELQQALLLSGIAFAHQNLEQPEDAITAIEDSMKKLRNGDIKNSPLEKEALIHSLNIQGAIYKEQENNQIATEAYKEAFDLLQLNSDQLNPLNSETKIITFDTIQSVHRELTDLLNTELAQNNDLLSKVRKFIQNYFYPELENRLMNKNWKEADKLTAEIMWGLAGKSQERSFRAEVSQMFPCEDLRTIDNLWTNYSGQDFGFSVQRSIWQSSEVNGNLIKFMSSVGWGKLEKQKDGKVILFFLPVTSFSDDAPKGQLPWFVTWEGSDGIRDRTAYMDRIVSCGI